MRQRWIGLPALLILISLNIVVGEVTKADSSLIQSLSRAIRSPIEFAFLTALIPATHERILAIFEIKMGLILLNVDLRQIFVDIAIQIDLTTAFLLAEG